MIGLRAVSLSRHRFPALIPNTYFIAVGLPSYIGFVFFSEISLIGEDNCLFISSAFRFFKIDQLILVVKKKKHALSYLS